MIKFEGCFSFPFTCGVRCAGEGLCALIDHGVHLEGGADVIPKSSSPSQFPQGNLTVRVNCGQEHFEFGAH